MEKTPSYKLIPLLAAMAACATTKNNRNKAIEPVDSIVEELIEDVGTHSALNQIGSPTDARCETHDNFLVAKQRAIFNARLRKADKEGRIIEVETSEGYGLDTDGVVRYPVIAGHELHGNDHTVCAVALDEGEVPSLKNELSEDAIRGSDVNEALARMNISYMGIQPDGSLVDCTVSKSGKNSSLANTTATNRARETLGEIVEGVQLITSSNLDSTKKEAQNFAILKGYEPVNRGRAGEIACVQLRKK